MLKNKLAIAIVTMCLLLGTVPFALGATTTSSNQVYISALYVGAPHQTVNQEYVKITNKGTTAVKMTGWKITDKRALHTYKFPSSYILKSKTTVTLYTGKGTKTATKLFWGRSAYVWNNEGDKANLYNSLGKLVSTKVGLKQK